MKKVIRKLFIFSLIVLFLPVIQLLAQTDSTGAFVSINLSPQNPNPGQQIKVSLQSFSVDLDRSKITWSVNGVNKKTEMGVKDYYTNAGVAGKLMTISASLVTPDGKTVEKEVSFIPAGVDLLFEAVSYTPPFYKGRALNINQGTVVVVAFPELFDRSGQKLATNKLIYNWKKDGVVQGASSGVGKSAFTFSGSVPIRDAEIEVTVSSPDQSIVANNAITIGTEDPLIIFYENSPVYGIMLNRAIKNTVNLNSDEFSVIAVPYFFSAGYANTPNLDYVWSLNGRNIENQELKNIFTGRQEQKGAGIANIGLKINNNLRIFQFANNDFSINFQKQ